MSNSKVSEDHNHWTVQPPSTDSLAIEIFPCEHEACLISDEVISHFQDPEHTTDAELRPWKRRKPVKWILFYMKES